MNLFELAAQVADEHLRYCFVERHSFGEIGASVGVEKCETYDDAFMALLLAWLGIQRPRLARFVPDRDETIRRARRDRRILRSADATASGSMQSSGRASDMD